MNCGRSSSVEWKLPKLQRRVRFPSPAPPPPGRVPGGFVMPASRPPSTECGGTIGAKLSPRKLGARCPGIKLAQHAQNGLILHVLLLLGEFYPVFVANKPSMANFVPLPPTTSPVRHQSRNKTRPARATHRHFRYKTRPARATHRHFRYKTRPARPKWPHLARFPLAGRVLSRFCRQQAEQGEFSPAPAEAPSRARKKQHPNTTLQAAR